MANDGQKIEWWRVSRIQGLFDRHAAKQSNGESRRSLEEVSTRFGELVDQVHNGSYGEIGGKPATLEQAIDNVLKPMEKVGKLAAEKFDSAAGDAFDEIRVAFGFAGKDIVNTLKKVHDQSVAAENARARNYPSIH